MNQMSSVQDENIPYLTEYHLPEFCFCDEELRYLYKCSACETIVVRKSDSPPDVMDHYCRLDDFRIFNPILNKIGETFVKECEKELYFRRL